MEGSAATKSEVEHFLSSNEFTGYQSVPLPWGLKVPGTDCSGVARKLLAQRVQGKSLLDVGTYYGYFPYEAMQLGAVRAVGIEADPERCELARRIAQLNGSGYEIFQGRAEEARFDEPFDIVLLLNVLHHVLDPVATIRRLVDCCKETLIVEFCLPDDPQYLRYLHKSSSSFAKRIQTGIQSLILRHLTRGVPLMAVGNRSYHRTFYFSREAFYNLFAIHLGFFDHIEFLPPLNQRRRVIAICRLQDKKNG